MEVGEAPGGAVGATAAAAAEAAGAHGTTLLRGAGDAGDDDAHWLHDAQPAPAVGTPMSLGTGFGAPLAGGQPQFMADDGFAEHDMPTPAVAPTAALHIGGHGMMEADDDFGGFDVDWQEQPQQQPLQPPQQLPPMPQQQHDAPLPLPPPPPWAPPQQHRGEQTPSSTGHSPLVDAPTAPQLQPQLSLASQPLATVVDIKNQSRYPAAKLIPTLDKLVAFINANGLKGLKIHFDSSFMQNAPAAVSGRCGSTWDGASSACCPHAVLVWCFATHTRPVLGMAATLCVCCVRRSAVQKELYDYAKREEAIVTLGDNGSIVPAPNKVNVLMVSRCLMMSGGLHHRNGDHFLSRYLLEGAHVFSEEFFAAVQHGGGALSHVRSGANVPWEFFAGGACSRVFVVRQLPGLGGIVSWGRSWRSMTLVAPLAPRRAKVVCCCWTRW